MKTSSYSLVARAIVVTDLLGQARSGPCREMFAGLGGFMQDVYHWKKGGGRILCFYSF